MLRNIGPIELLIILVIVILIFGVGRVSEIGAALGKSIREFRREIRKSEEEPETKEKDTQGEKDTQEEE
ncbi:MAG: twin-arginine translocase TatA/TatE family subunit [Chloroflexi bacterium]|nr:twin-arginine translocase TatA/TatE family subunit [Chloroflexota bacterium]